MYLHREKTLGVCITYSLQPTCSTCSQTSPNVHGATWEIYIPDKTWIIEPRRQLLLHILEQYTTDVACSTNMVYTSAYITTSFKYVEPHHIVHPSTPYLAKGIAIFSVSCI